MRRTEFDRFSMALTACAELYGKTVSEGAMALWWQALERFDVEQVESAFRGVVEDPDGGQFMPKPADIIRRLEGTATDRSLIAWGKVLDAMQRVGAYRSVAFDDGAIHVAIEDMGGWPAVCRSKTDELPFLQRRFCDAHRAYSRRGAALQYPARLAGDHELQNRQLGFQSEPPTLIGDPEAAMRVMTNGAAGPKTTITVAGALQATGQKRIGRAA